MFIFSTLKTFTIWLWSRTELPRVFHYHISSIAQINKHFYQADYINILSDTKHKKQYNVPIRCGRLGYRVSKNSNRKKVMRRGQEP